MEDSITQKNKNTQINTGDAPVVVAGNIDDNGKMNTVYVVNSKSNTVSVISGDNNTKLEDIPVGDNPSDIAVNPNKDNIYVANTGNNTVSVISGDNNTLVNVIPVGDNPSDIAVNENTYNIYVANAGSDTVSVISEDDNKVIKNITVGDKPSYIDIYNGKVYVANAGSDTVSVISEDDNKVIKNITVGDYPSNIAINPNTQKVYVANSGNNTVSVISGDNNTKLEDIPVGDNPSDIAVNTFTNTVYVSNRNSGGLSVIDSYSDMVVAGIKFQITPILSGYIKCDNKIIPTSHYFYVEGRIECIAIPNKGFEFLSWEENLNNNSTQIINVSKSASPLDSIKDFFNLKSEEPEAKLKITKFGSFTANFKELPPPLPAEYWATLFGVVVTAFISSWLTPTIIGWRKTKKYQAKLNDYQTELKDLYKDGKFDKNDISSLDRLRDKVISGYTRGDITKEQYDVLLNNISTRYNEIFQNEINVLKNTNNNAEKIKLLEEIQSDLNDAYLKKKIDKEHYDLLKEMISK